MYFIFIHYLLLLNIDNITIILRIIQLPRGRGYAEVVIMFIIIIIILLL